MKKTEYLAPETFVVSAALQQMIAYSGGGANVSLTVNGDADNDDGDNRSRRIYNAWESDSPEDDYEEF